MPVTNISGKESSDNQNEADLLYSSLNVLALNRTETENVHNNMVTKKGLIQESFYLEFRFRAYLFYTCYTSP